MVTSQQALKKYGEPNPDFERKWMVLWPVPEDIRKAIPALPPKLYANKDFIKPVEAAFRALIANGYYKEINSFGGIFNVRAKRNLSSMSLHSWGIAMDLNAPDNALGKTREQLIAAGKKPFSDKFFDAFRNNGFDCGADWKSPSDLMHVQLKTI